MDLGLFRDGERFPTFDSLDYDYAGDSHSPNGIDNGSNNFWEQDTELEINGDLALIPMSSTLYESLNLLDNSPNVKDDMMSKIMNDWQQLIHNENGEEFTLDDAMSEVAGEQAAILAYAESALNMPEPSNFDIANYIDDTLPPPPSPVETPSSAGFETKQNVAQRKLGIGVKKIDMKAQRYIVEEDNEGEDDVDVETVSECGGNVPVLEAGDLNSLLEQFEATELPDMSINLLDTSITSIDESHLDNLDLDSLSLLPESLVTNEQTPANDVYTVKQINPEDFLQSDPIDLNKDVNNVETKPKLNVEAIKKEKETPQKAISQDIKPELPKPELTPTPINKSSTTSSSDNNKNTAILDQLPKELIDRIKESGKRKPISVIPPMPSRKRGARCHDAGAPQRVLKVPEQTPDTVKLDHDYCTVQTGYSKYPKKDSGFESSEEDDNIKRQPIVKNTDGKLMVSLLKVNTIHDTSKKKKLNLEEYKKRRIGVLRAKASSTQTSSPMSSNCGSPTPEDQTLKVKKHQEKLMRMAKEVLTAAPKSETPSATPAKNTATAPEPIQIEKVIVPPDMVRKTVVSIGVNTDFVTIDEDFKKGQKDPLAPVHQLEEIKPLLEKVSGQIGRNSLITSVIENIPKVITKSTTETATSANDRLADHGEDKTIIYLPKNRNSVKTVSTEVQTNISLLTENKQRRYRRRNSSCSSSSSESSPDRKNSRFNRKRKVSTSSIYSVSSDSGSSSYSYSSRSSSRSRSRSRSNTPPRTKRKTRKVDEEHLKEVEERRVIYVGRIASSTTKEDLRKRFSKFGPITNVSLHFRDHGDNYGFVTFKNKYDAYEALEHGNDDPYLPKYDLSFGGRRIFCQTSYSDLDNMRDEMTYPTATRVADNSFDMLLKQAQEKIRKRKA
ncbi:uncharacterized protein LOC109600958 isoform X2 [Aethina tumida]|uniref:uncharacterized protein LOC109600958 isoform X2 n=1 Tax=Aethina tumida TaxID=116153 RepID=UPI0021489FA2|nr:uncharacterized protein LOC109600958 isoform X2 [Aethina tumida]